MWDMDMDGLPRGCSQLSGKGAAWFVYWDQNTVICVQSTYSQIAGQNI